MTPEDDFITVNNTYLSSTPKYVILNLPGFDDDKHLNYSVNQLRQELKNFMREHNHSKSKAWRIDDYIDLYNKIPQAPKQLKPLPKYIDSPEYKSRQQKKHDKELFNKIKSKQQESINEQKKKNEYHQSIKDKARQEYKNKQNLIYDELDILNITKTDDIVKEYKNRVNKIKDRNQFKQWLTKWMNLVMDNKGFDVDIGDNEEMRLAFCEVLRSVYSHKETNKAAIIVKATDLNGKIKYFTLNNPIAKKSNVKSIDILIGHIFSEIDLQTNASDTNPYVTDAFVPVKYELMFLKTENIKNNNNKKKKRFYHEKYNDESNDIEIIEDELDEDFRDIIEGSFFRYINLSNIDLSRYQIFSKIDPNNYQDNCFVYACSQSGVFSDEEMDSLRRKVLTRSVPNKLIYEIAKTFNCNTNY